MMYRFYCMQLLFAYRDIVVMHPICGYDRYRDMNKL